MSRSLPIDGYRVVVPEQKYTADAVVVRRGEYAIAYNAHGQPIAASTDHTQVIQKAIDYVGGGKIYVDGEFVLDDYVTLQGKEIIIEFAPGSRITLGNANAGFVINKTAHKVSGIINLRLDMNALDGAIGLEIRDSWHQIIDGLIIENIGTNSKGIWIHGTDNNWLCIMNWVRARKIRGAGTSPPSGSIGVEISSDPGVSKNTNNVVDVGYLSNLDTGVKLGGNNNEVRGIVGRNNIGIDVVEGSHVLLGMHEEANNTYGIIVRDGAWAILIPRYYEKLTNEGTGKLVIIDKGGVYLRSRYPESTPLIDFFQQGNYALKLRGFGTDIRIYDSIQDKDIIYFTNDGRVWATGGVQTRVDVDDYGGNFANYDPGTCREGLVVIAIDTNSSAPGKRIYVCANGEWHYVDLT